jgi:hypothetical protein
VLDSNGDARRVATDDRARYFGAELEEDSLIPGNDAHIAPTRFEDWLSQTTENEAHKARQEGGPDLNR